MSMRLLWFYENRDFGHSRKIISAELGFLPPSFADFGGQADIEAGDLSAIGLATADRNRSWPRQKLWRELARIFTNTWPHKAQSKGPPLDRGIIPLSDIPLSKSGPEKKFKRTKRVQACPSVSVSESDRGMFDRGIIPLTGTAGLKLAKEIIFLQSFRINTHSKIYLLVIVELI